MSGLTFAQLQALGFSNNTRGVFLKNDDRSPAFVKTGANTLALKAGTAASVAGRLRTFAADTNVVMPALTPGTDYAIYLCADGTVRADVSATAPAGYTTANSRKLGGFHYGLVPVGETLAGGQFNTAGSVTTGGMVWTQPDVDALAGINAHSLWDLRWRPICDPRGMVCVAGNFWADIYLCNTDVDANGTSRFNQPIASGTVLPKVPAAFGGNGTLTYGNCNWWTAAELAGAAGKSLLSEAEFVQAAFGVTEAVALGGAASTPPATVREPRFTSKWGLEQASGHVWIWGQDANYGGDGVWTYSGAASTIGRGQVFRQGSVGVVRVRLGGARDNGSICGSRASNWSGAPWNSLWNIGLRARCDHLALA
jgi:hypothetical protein